MRNNMSDGDMMADVYWQDTKYKEVPEDTGKTEVAKRIIQAKNAILK